MTTGRINQVAALFLRGKGAAERKRSHDSLAVPGLQAGLSEAKRALFGYVGNSRCADRAPRPWHAGAGAEGNACFESGLTRLPPPPAKRRGWRTRSRDLAAASRRRGRCASWPRAASTAASTSAPSLDGTEVMTSPVAGASTSSVAPLFAATHCPPMKFACFTSAPRVGIESPNRASSTARWQAIMCRLRELASRGLRCAGVSWESCRSQVEVDAGSPADSRGARW